MTTLLLDSGAEVNPRKDSEVGAIFRAAEKGHKTTVKLLLDRKASAEARDKYGRTSIFPAAVLGYSEVLKLLLEREADINARDKENRTVLIHMAAEKLFKWNSSIFQYLLDMGADVEARDNAKRTALIWAADSGKTEMVKILLEGKVRPNIEAYVRSLSPCLCSSRALSNY
jgi:ankyrin repeat protein